MIKYKDKINWGLDIATLHKEKFVFLQLYLQKLHKMAKIKDNVEQTVVFRVRCVTVVKGACLSVRLIHKI